MTFFSSFRENSPRILFFASSILDKIIVYTWFSKSKQRVCKNLYPIQGIFYVGRNILEQILFELIFFIIEIKSMYVVNKY